MHQITTIAANSTITIVKHPHDWQRIINARQYQLHTPHHWYHLWHAQCEGVRQCIK